MGAAGGGIKPPITYSVSTYLQNTNRQTKDEPASSLLLTPQDREILENVYKRRRMQRISKSHDFDRIKLTKYDRLSKSTGHSLQSGNKEKMTIKRHLSHLPIISFGKEKEKVLDVIDRVDELR